MADFKERRQGYIGELEPHQRALVTGDYTLPFGGDIEQGGIYATNGEVAQVSPPNWYINPQATPSDRAMPLSKLEISSTGAIGLKRHHGLNPQNPGVAAEIEMVVTRTDGTPWNVLPDGNTLVFPDGMSQPAEDADIGAELMQRNAEIATRVSHGYRAHTQTVTQELKRVNGFLGRHGLVTPPLSLDPFPFHRRDVSQHPWVQLITQPDKMPYISRFAALSTQLHVDMSSIPDALRALNSYQTLHGFFNLLTEAAPISNLAVDTSLGNYLNGYRPNGMLPTQAENAENVRSIKELYGTNHTSLIPHDWRQLARLCGSPSSGPYQVPLPMTAEEYFGLGNKQLAAGHIVSIARAGGWFGRQHGDRMRVDIGTVEICNPGTAGLSVYKLPAIQRVLAKTMVALQLCRSGRDFNTRAYRNLFGVPDSMEARWQQCKLARTNNIRTAIEGGNAPFVIADGTSQGQEVDGAEYWKRLKKLIGEFSPERVSYQEDEEVKALLGPTPNENRFRKMSPGDFLLENFYRPYSPWTYNQAVRVAHKLSGENTTKTIAAGGLALQAHLRQAA